MASMAAKRDYYEVLGVSKNASEKDIAAAYRKLAIKYHPDRNQDESTTEKFKEAAEAYEVLHDPQKRGRYDQFGHAGVDGQASFHDVSDIFEAFGDIFGGGGIFGDIFGGGGGRRGGRRTRRGGDVRVDVTLTLEEAARGVTKTLEFERSEKCETCDGGGSRPGSNPEPCRRCGGHGQVAQSMGFVRVQSTCPTCQGAGNVITHPCVDCSGRGYVKGVVEKSVPIPAGVDDGMRVRIAGEGEPSPEGGPNGDCYCFVRVRAHHLFHRDGSNLILQMPITYTQATLGATIEIPTLDGPDQVVIPKGTQSGDVFRNRGKGVPDPQRGGVGDLLVQTYIETPKKLNKQQEKLLRELAELEHVNVTPQRKGFLDKIRNYFSGMESHSNGET